MLALAYVAVVFGRTAGKIRIGCCESTLVISWQKAFRVPAAEWVAPIMHTAIQSVADHVDLFEIALFYL